MNGWSPCAKVQRHIALVAPVGGARVAHSTTHAVPIPLRNTAAEILALRHALARLGALVGHRSVLASIWTHFFLFEGIVCVCVCVS